MYFSNRKIPPECIKNKITQMKWRRTRNGGTRIMGLTCKYLLLCIPRCAHFIKRVSVQYFVVIVCLYALQSLPQKEKKHIHLVFSEL